MPNTNPRTALWVRIGVTLAAVAAFCVGSDRLGFGIGASGEGPARPALTDPILAIYLATVALTFLALLRRSLAAPAVLGLALAFDALAIGVLGVSLRRGDTGEAFIPDAVPFLVGYVVALLVAGIGRRRVATMLAGLAGLMVLATGTWLVAMAERQGAPLGLFAMQAVLLLAGTLETGFVMGWLGEATERARMAERVERELRARETESGELVAFAQALAASGTLTEVLDAVLRYMRAHLPVRVRAVAVEAVGETVALWEEPARFDPEHTERRRLRLQQAAARAGAKFPIARLDVRSLGNGSASTDFAWPSLVEIPIQVGGRVAGVVLAADPHRHSIPGPRIGVLADMARRTGEAIQRVERRAEEEHRRTTLLLRQMREGVLLLSPDGQVLLANPAARDALQASLAEGRELPVAIGPVSLADLATTPAGVTRRFRAEVRPLGAHRAVLLACTAVGILEGSRRLGTLVTLSDITEEELARGRLVQSEKMTLVGQTLAGVAHELNNPLAALIGYADILDARKVAPEIEKPVRQMREQAMRAARIVRNLLNFAKRRNPERMPTQLAELVQGVVELFAYEIRLNDIAIACDLPGDLPAVLGDKHSLQQVLVNVVQNAIHALQDRQGDRRIAITGRAVSDRVVVSVKDSGTGVPQDFRARIFEPFFTTKGAARGTGLGLALSRTIARDHGGDLVLEPDDGTGASFTLHLPLPRQATATTTPEAALPRDAAPTGAPAPDGAARPGSGQFHVLVVDDEQPVRETLVAQLGKMGCRVDSASNAAEAQRHILRLDYDAILMDVRMPGGTGIDLHKRLATERPTAAQRIVFMTGDFANEEVVQGIRDTGNALLEKPFTLEELTRALHGRPGAPVPDRRLGRSVTIGARVGAA